MTAFDLVVVGAGSAGAVLASRLAAGGRRVLLLEAGPEQPASQNPLRDGTKLILNGFNWDYQANLRGGEQTRALWGRFPYRLGKVVGGSSSVNGAVAMRALPRDFADWGPEWSWEHVLPFYDRVAVPIRQPQQLHELDVAFLAECGRMGLADIDLNGGTEVGVGAVPANAIDGVRMDTAATYLADRPPNLEVRTGCHVTRVLLDGRRATGVEVLCDNELSTISAREVVLSAGAIGSPIILQRSGIDLPGLGENLVDHPSVVIWAKPVDGLCKPGIPWRQVATRMASGDDGADVQVWLLNNVESSTIPGFANRLGWDMVVGISVMLLRPKARGRVYLRDDRPVIELGFGSADDDIERLAFGVRKAWRILRSFGDQLEEIQLWTDAMISDDRLLHSAIRNVMSPGWHAIGSARMGTVVDQSCRVHGYAGLRVVDASVFPTMPSAPTNLTTMMLAEKIASGMES